MVDFSYDPGWRLLVAVKNKKPDVVTSLLLEGVDPNYKKDQHSHTPLTQAVEAASDDIVGLLLGKEDTDPNKAGYDGMTPLTLAITQVTKYNSVP